LFCRIPLVGVADCGFREPVPVAGLNLRGFSHGNTGAARYAINGRLREISAEPTSPGRYRFPAGAAGWTPPRPWLAPSTAAV